MRLMVTGSRHHGHEQRVFEALDTLHAADPIDVLIHGDCPDTPGKPRSLDQLAAEWATRRGIHIDPYPADWDNIHAIPCRIKVRRGKPYNALAGFARNTRMILQGVPHFGAVFPVRGPGTEHARNQLLRHRIPVIDIEL